MLHLAAPSDLRVDLNVLLFALAVTFASALFFGLRRPWELRART